MDFSFQEVTDAVKDTAKKIPSWGWVALAGGVFVLAMATRPKVSTPPITRLNASGGLPTGLSGGDPQSMSAGTDGVLSQLNEDLKNVQAQNNELKSGFNNIATEFQSYQTNTDKILAETDKTFETLSKSLAFEQTLGAIPNIYFDGQTDSDQYRAVFQAVGTNVTSREEADKLLTRSAGLGNNGVADPNTKQAGVSVASIKASAETLASEIDRTNRVIANRKASGLDTSAQESWLKKLQTN